MSKIILVIALVLTCAGGVGHASPARPLHRLQELPRGNHLLATDPGSDVIHVFGDAGEESGVIGKDTFSPLSARASKACSAMDATTVQKIPGWDEVLKFVNKEVGTGRRKISTNEAEYPRKPATICVTSELIDIAIDGEPQCSIHTQTIEGTLTGTNGTAEIAVTTGTDYKLETTASSQTTFGIGFTYSAKFGIPDIAEVGGETTIKAEISTTSGETTSASSNNQVTTMLTISHADGKKCKAELSVKTCTSYGSAQVPFIARGYVWFVYEQKVRGHYMWAA